jgi:hypothetical protein
MGYLRHNIQGHIDQGHIVTSPFSQYTSGRKSHETFYMKFCHDNQILTVCFKSKIPREFLYEVIHILPACFGSKSHETFYTKFRQVIQILKTGKNTRFSTRENAVYCLWSDFSTLVLSPRNQVGSLFLDPLISSIQISLGRSPSPPLLLLLLL